MNATSTKKIEKLVKPWGKLLKSNFNSFILFGLPELFEKMDHSKALRFKNMDYWYKEREKNEDGVRAHGQVAADLKNKEETYFYGRVQFSALPHLPAMMFDFHGQTMIRDFDIKATLFVLHINDDVPKHNNRFEMPTCLKFRFTHKLIKDLKKEDLQKSDNLFSTAILATKYWKEGGDDMEAKKRFKTEMLEELEKHGYTDFQKECLQEFVEEIYEI